MTCSSCGLPVAEGAQKCAACGTPIAGQGLPKTAVSNRLKNSAEERAVNPVRTNDVLSGRYRLEDKVGEGGMGTVYVAHDLELDRKVAVKLLAAALVNDAEVLERFEREAKLTASLDHPNIVPIYDVGRHEGRPFFVMKLLQGESLVARLRAKGGFTTDETLQLLRQLARGLDYLHGRGLIHRDIKAGNIFIGPDGHATILDFGILRQKSAAQGITRQGIVMGTPHYMAPEQALGLKDVDHRVDLYALAVVLFECLSGTLPFEADSELRLIQLQAHAPVPEILERAPWIPKNVAAVVRKALSKKPEDRFNSGAELTAALEHAYLEAKASKSNLPAVTSGPIPTVGTSTAASERRRRVSRVSNAALPVVQLQEPSTSELVQAVRSRRPLIAAAVGVFLLGAAGAYLALRPGEVKPLPVVEAPLAVDAGAPVVEAPVVDAGEEDAGAQAVVVAPTEDAGPLEDAGVLALVAVDAGVALSEPDAGVIAVADPGGKRPPLSTNKKKGRVNVITTHGGEPYWAQVSIDGVPKGRTPLLIDLPQGSYRVLVERAGFRAQTRQVRVAGGGKVLLQLELKP